MNEELRQSRLLAKQALDAERRAEYAEKRVISERKKLTSYLSAIKRKAEQRRKEHKISLEKVLKKIAYEKKYARKIKRWKQMKEDEEEGLSDEEIRARYDERKRREEE